MYKPIKKVTMVAEAKTHDGIIDQIAEQMWFLINRDTKDEIIINQARKLVGASKFDTIKNVFDYVKNKMPYVSDPDDREQLTAPIHYIQNNKKGGDCDDMVMLQSALLNALGIKTRLKAIAWRKPELTHVVLDAYDGSRWIELDATMKFDGFDVKSRMPINIKKIRYKLYENPMQLTIEKLSDNPQNCVGTALSDCGCKKCKGKRGLTGNENINVNVTPIVLGNTTNSEKNNSENIDLPIDINQYLNTQRAKQKELQKAEEVGQINIKPEQKAEKEPAKVPVRALTMANGTTYFYKFS